MNNLTTTKNDYRFDTQYVRNKRQIKTLRKENAKQQTEIKILFGVLFSLLITIGFMGFKINQLSNSLYQVSEKNEVLLAENKSLSENYNELSQLLYETSEIAVTLDKEVETLKSDNISLNQTLKEYEEREELFSKYEYAIIRKNGTRTDLTYDNIKSLETITSEKGMSEESVDLILSIVMTESDGIETAENTNSTATGFGQFLSGTGKFVYTKLMEHDNYDHELVAKNGSANLEMMVNYLDYLDIKYNGDIDLVINEYRGENNPSYKSKINSYLMCKNLNLATINIRE